MPTSKAKNATGTKVSVVALDGAGAIPTTPVWIDIAELKTVKITDSTSTVDVTSFDSAGFADFIIGRRDMKVSGDGNLVTGNAGDTAVQTAQTAGVGLGIKVLCTDLRAWTGVVINTQRDIDMTDANPNKVSYSWQVRGKLTEV